MLHFSQNRIQEHKTNYTHRLVKDGKSRNSSRNDLITYGRMPWNLAKTRSRFVIMRAKYETVQSIHIRIFILESLEKKAESVQT